MNALRLQQNFRGSRAHFVLQDAGVSDVLATALKRLGVEVATTSVQTAAVSLPELAADRDIVFLDGDVDFSFDPPLFRAGHLPPAPIIGIVGMEAPSRLKGLIHAGATAFLRKPVHTGSVYSALFMGMNGYLRWRDLESRIAARDQRRRGRRSVVKAILLVMDQNGVDDDEAYAILRRACMKARVSLEDYCESLVGTTQVERIRRLTASAARSGRAK